MTSKCKCGHEHQHFSDPPKIMDICPKVSCKCEKFSPSSEKCKNCRLRIDSHIWDEEQHEYFCSTDANKKFTPEDEIPQDIECPNCENGCIRCDARKQKKPCGRIYQEKPFGIEVVCSKSYPCPSYSPNQSQSGRSNRKETWKKQPADKPVDTTNRNEAGTPEDSSLHRTGSSGNHTLSDERIDGNSISWIEKRKFYYPEKNVKESIQRLKEEFSGFSGNGVKIINLTIDKIFGDKLVMKGGVK